MKQKKALLIGINYENNDKSKLGGCINDANLLKKFIKEKLNYKENDITMMTDVSNKSNTKSINIIPTRDNILNQMQKLFSFENTEMFLSYSGHGSNSYNSDEYDLQDELLVTSDNKIIIDTEIRALINNSMPKSSTLSVIMDACNSGTNFDLPYKYANKNVSKTGEDVGNLPYIIKLSSSKDDQLSREGTINGVKNGFFTYFFVEKYNSNYTYKKMIDVLDEDINNFLPEDNKQTCIATSSEKNAFDDKLFSKIVVDDDENIGIILGLTLGLGIPVLLVIIFSVYNKVK